MSKNYTKFIQVTGSLYSKFFRSNVLKVPSLFSALFVTLIISLSSVSVKAQLAYVHANSVKSASSSTLTEFAVLNSSDATDFDFSTKATLIGDAGAALGLGKKTSRLELSFPSAVPANTNLYVVLSEDGAGLLDYLVGGTLGSLVDGLVGSLLTGNPQITIRGKNTTSTVFSKVINKDDLAGASIVIGEDGRSYLPIRTTGEINSIEVNYEVNALVGLTASRDSIHVHDIFYATGSSLPCEAFYTTSYDAPGISLSLLTNIPNPVNNPHHAIDDIDTNYSEIGNQGVLTVSALQSFKQTVNFNELSDVNEQVVIKYSMSDANLLDLALLNNITIKGYRGTSEVYSSSLSSILDLDLLAILNLTLGDNRPNVVTIPIDSTFTSVDVIYNQTITAGVASKPLQLYGVYKAPKKPELDSNIVVVCDSMDYTVNLINPLVGVTYTWYDKDLNIVGTGTSFTVLTPSDGMSDTFFVTSHICDNQKSEFVPLVLNANNAICTSSDLAGTLDRTEYISPTPIFAVLVNSEAEVVQNKIVDYLGNYTFEGVNKGEYEVIVVATTAPMPVGDTYTTVVSNLGLSYNVTPIKHEIYVDGSGKNDTIPDFNVSYLGEPNVRTSVTSASSSIATGSSTTVTYRIFNTGGRATNGTITCYIAKPSNGTLTISEAPTGWILSSTDAAYVLSTSNPLNTGLPSAVVVTGTYTPSGTTPSSQNFTITIPTGSAADEDVPYDNNALRNILINY